jgi:two-component system nitrogen regulation response regulator GlnG
MVEKQAELGCLGRFLFVGPMVNERVELFDSLEALGVHSENATDFDKAVKRGPEFDFILFAPNDKSDIARVKTLRESGKAIGLVLMPDDKGLAPLGLKAGARTVFVDKIHPDEIVRFAQGLNEECLLRREIRWLRQEVRQNVRESGPIGESAAAGRLRRAIGQAGKKYQTVVLRGEKGANFLQVARALHLQHPNLRHPMIHWEGARRPVTALNKALRRLEGRKGDEGELLSLGGSLFIEDAQLLPSDIQYRLIASVSQGGVSSLFRLIIGQTQDPERLFQDDLMPQLGKENKVHLVRIPPLRERRKDIPDISNAILDELAVRIGGNRRTLTPAAVEMLSSQKWWGNEAELEQTLWRAFLLTDGRTISVDNFKPSSKGRKVSDIEDFFRDRLASVVACLRDGQESDFYAHTIRSVEKPLFELVLRESGGNQMKAARLLGMNRNTLRRRVSELGLVRRVPARSRSRER